MNNLRFLLVSIVALALASCGGGDDGTILVPGGGSSGGGDDGGGGTTTYTYAFGSGTPGALNSGVIAVAVPSLAAGGSTSLSVAIVQTDDNNVSSFYTGEADITFSSSCIANGLATVTPNPVTTGTGAATVSYAATGCAGDDVITATTVVGSSTFTATATVTVAAAAVGSIQFISATPSKIGLKGTGGVGLPETSAVVFKVVDATGGPVAGASVTFSADTTVGGLSILPDPPTAISGANGEVQAVVNSGTVATSVRVTATVTSVTPNIGTQSSQLVITTGLPDQNSFSVAVACSNIEAYDYDGVTNAVTVRLSDRFNNPVPDGTAVTFNAEGGSIAGSCTTSTTTGTSSQSGVCTVNWISSNPRPLDGRATILATAIGEETFSDVNGNGVFDNPDGFPIPANVQQVGDLVEAFRDDNENNLHDPGEFFFDFDQNTTYGTGDGLFNGLLCQDTNGRCGISDKTGIFASNLIIMSGSAAIITDDVGGTLNSPGTVTFSISDVRGQPMPAGTTVTVSYTNGKAVGPSSYEMPCTSFNGPWEFPFTFDSDPAAPATGLIFVTVETPQGVVTTRSISIID
jgi:hypothetical protein